MVRVFWKGTTTALYEHCTVGDYDIDPGQAATASTMVGVVTMRELPERAAVLALAAGLQESKLENLPPNAGDRDSVGVLQQRPSQGWGTNAQLNDVHYATGAFLDALVKVPNWQGLIWPPRCRMCRTRPTAARTPSTHDEAQVFADALGGKPPAGITCAFDKPTKVAERHRWWQGCVGPAGEPTGDFRSDRLGAGGEVADRGVVRGERRTAWASTRSATTASSGPARRAGPPRRRRRPASPPRSPNSDGRK